MGVQEGQHLPAGHAGPQQPGRYQPFPLLLPHHPHDLQLLHVALQLILQVVWGGSGREESHRLQVSGGAQPQLLAPSPLGPCPLELG